MASISGTNVAAPIAPFDTQDTFPTHDAQYGKGGFRSVANKTALNDIPAQRLTDGCLCYVVGEKTTYRYVVSGSTGSWIEVEKEYTQSEWEAETDKETVIKKYEKLYITE